jgi:hypothetical protein
MFSKRTRTTQAIGLLALLTLTSCQGEGGLFPSTSTISQAVKDACEGVMDESGMLAALIAARLDQFNGYTKDEELSSALQACSVDALISDITANECAVCKAAILDQIYGP